MSDTALRQRLRELGYAEVGKIADPEAARQALRQIGPFSGLKAVYAEDRRRKGKRF